MQWFQIIIRISFILQIFGLTTTIIDQKEQSQLTKGIIFHLILIMITDLIILWLYYIIIWIIILNQGVKLLFSHWLKILMFTKLKDLIFIVLLNSNNT